MERFSSDWKLRSTATRESSGVGGRQILEVTKLGVDEMAIGKNNDEFVINARPTKEFFIYMLTKDIPLIRAIIDLIDNSWDGALRVSKSHPFNQLVINLDITHDAFAISDNCGGIPYLIAKNYAFRFGRPTEMERTDHSVGQFGVGMKRSLFKIGEKFVVESTSPDSTFSVSVDVMKWVKLTEWEFRFDDLTHHDRSPSWSKCGTRITVTDLHERVKADFGSEVFLSELRDAIESTHEQSLGKGITIKINDVPVGVRVATLKKSNKLKPGHVKLQIDESSENPVDVNIFAGVSDSEPQSAGWNVYCNGRMVLEADSSSVTGWGTANTFVIPRYHNQFARFRGYVFFECNDASKLPWNTTKTGVDVNTPIYQAVQQKMVELMRPVIDFLNRVDREKEVNESDQVLTKTVDKAKLVQLQFTDEQTTFLSPESKPDAEEAQAIRRISYQVSAEKFDEVKGSLGATSNKEVGEKTFEYYYDLEC